jgi:hypothetical protein
LNNNLEVQRHCLMGKKFGKASLDLRHRLPAADEDARPVFEDLHLVAADLAEVDFIDIGHIPSLTSSSAEHIYVSNWSSFIRGHPLIS